MAELLLRFIFWHQQAKYTDFNLLEMRLLDFLKALKDLSISQQSFQGFH